MHYEEKLIDGVWYWRSTPDGEWSVKKMQMSKADEEKMTNNNDIQAALDGLLAKNKPLSDCLDELKWENYRGYKRAIGDVCALAQQQPDDETYQKLVHTQSDLEHSRTFAKDLSRQLDELKRECAAVKIELARIRKQQPVNAELLQLLREVLYYDDKHDALPTHIEFKIRKAIARAEQKGGA